VEFARFLGTVAVALEHLFPGAAAPHRLCRRKDGFDVHRSVRRRLARVLDDDPPEVVGAAQRLCRQHPDAHEVGEVAVLVELGQLVSVSRRHGNVVPACDLEQRRGLHRPLEVNVQLDLRIWHWLPLCARSDEGAPGQAVRGVAEGPPLTGL
jgi:hypothetical protein